MRSSVYTLYGSLTQEASQITGDTISVLETAPSIVTNSSNEDDYSVSSSAMDNQDDYHHHNSNGNWMDCLWFERMQHEFNCSRRFENDNDDIGMDLNHFPESGQSDNANQSNFSVWDMGCEDKDIYMLDY